MLRGSLRFGLSNYIENFVSATQVEVKPFREKSIGKKSQLPLGSPNMFVGFAACIVVLV